MKKKKIISIDIAGGEDETIKCEYEVIGGVHHLRSFQAIKPKRNVRVYCINGTKIEEFDLRTILQEYSEFLEDNGYLDTDWRQEEPLAIDDFIEELK